MKSKSKRHLRVLALALAIFVQGAVDPLCPEIVVAVSEIVDQPGDQQETGGREHSPQRSGDGSPIKQKALGDIV